METIGDSLRQRETGNRFGNEVLSADDHEFKSVCVLVMYIGD
jgi:hypothetical protein